jgi:polynucleotide 5'-hydroxyl-kinase GRC3/NOL9
MSFRPTWLRVPWPVSLTDPRPAGADVPAFPDIPPEWAEAADRILRDARRRVAVIGPVDAGKSTFCRFLVAHAAGTGRSAGLLDTDIGQKTLGPPACVTVSDAGGLRLAFVGTTSPVHGWNRLIAGTHRLARQADAKLLVVNTSGLLAGPGRRLKAAKIQALRPDLLVTLGDSPDLGPVLDDHPQTPVLRLSPSPSARRKTDGERRAIRRNAFKAYFEAAMPVALRPRQVSMPFHDPLPERLLVGLSDEGGEDVGLGILTGTSGNAGITILTPVADSLIHRVVPGFLCLNEGFSETRAAATQ